MRVRGLGGELESLLPNPELALGFRVEAESWNMALGGLVLGSLILYLKGMRIMMFQLSGFYHRV